MQKMTKEEALTKVAQGVGSIYSKEDVLNLINSIESGSTSITEELMETIANEVAQELCSDNGSLIDDCEIDIQQNGYGNTSFDVEVTDVDLNECRIAEIVQDVLESNLDTEEEEVVKEEVEEVEETVETD